MELKVLSETESDEELSLLSENGTEKGVAKNKSRKAVEGKPLSLQAIWTVSFLRCGKFINITYSWIEHITLKILFHHKICNGVSACTLFPVSHNLHALC